MYKDEKFWDRIASNYDRIEAKDIAYKIFIERARKYLKAEDTLLDFGCGTGLICNEIAENVGFIHAIDISNKMIEIARNKASERRIQNIEFEQTTIFDTIFQDNSIDAIIIFNIFHLLEEPAKYLRRIYQILKPGGLIISATPCLSETPTLKTILKFFSIFGFVPKINAFNSSELEMLLLSESFKTLEFIKFKPKSPQYLYISKKE